MSYRRRNVDQFQRVSLCFQIRLRVVVGGVEAHVAGISSRSDFDINNSSAGRMTAEVRWKIMQSKDGDKQQKCMDFLRRSRAPSHYGHLTISQAQQE